MSAQRLESPVGRPARSTLALVIALAADVLQWCCFRS